MKRQKMNDSSSCASHSCCEKNTGESRKEPGSSLDTGNEHSAETLASFRAVVTNELILRSIFKSASLHDLKSFRGVNHLWNHEASKMLRKNYVTCLIELSSDADTTEARLCNRMGTCCALTRKLVGGKAEKKPSKDTLEGFANLLGQSKSNDFPCNNFKFASSILPVPGFQDIMRAHGANIKVLIFSVAPAKPSKVPETLELLRNLLGKQLPNLEHLVIDTSHPKNSFMMATLLEIFNINPDEDDGEQLLMADNEDAVAGVEVLREFSFAPELQLPLLKTLDLTRAHKIKKYVPIEFLSQLLKAAVNMKTLKCDATIAENLDLLLELNAIHLLNNIELRFTKNGNMMGLYEELARRNPKLRKIDKIKLCSDLVSETSPWDTVSRQIGRILSKIFDSSAETLESLTVSFPLGLIPGLKLPSCPNLTEFVYGSENGDWDWNKNQLFTADRYTVPVFPKGSSLKVQWPQLSKLMLWFDMPVSDDVDLNAPASELLTKVTQLVSYDVTPIESVKKLLVSFDYCDRKGIPTSWIQYFSRLFPSVQKLEYGGSFHDILGASEHLWALQSLEKLTFKITVEDRSLPFPELEAAMTGFTPETCLRLYESSEEDVCKKMSEDEIKELRVRPSILDLKNFKKLRIHAAFFNTTLWDTHTPTALERNEQFGHNLFGEENADAVPAAENDNDAGEDEIENNGDVDSDDSDDDGEDEIENNGESDSDDNDDDDESKAKGKDVFSVEEVCDEDSDDGSANDEDKSKSDIGEVFSHVTDIFVFKVRPEIFLEYNVSII